MARTLADFLSAAAKSKVTFFIGVLLIIMKGIPNLLEMVHYFPSIQFSDLLILKDDFVSWYPYLENFVVWTGLGTAAIASRDANKTSEESGVKR